MGKQDIEQKIFFCSGLWSFCTWKEEDPTGQNDNVFIHLAKHKNGFMQFEY